MAIPQARSLVVSSGAVPDAPVTVKWFSSLNCYPGFLGFLGRSRAGWGERRVLGQDAGLEFPQRRARVDAQLAGQTITDFCVGAQGLGLPPAAVQGEDKQLVQALAERVLPAQSLQFPGELTVAAQPQIRRGPGFDRHQGQLAQMRPFGIKKPA